MSSPEKAGSGARNGLQSESEFWFHLDYTEPKFRLSREEVRSVGPKSKVAAGCDEPTGEERPLRADALRNRGRILEAAEVVFASEGIEAPVDVIAEKAGVGVGTLYRHFPTKEKLLRGHPARSPARPHRGRPCSGRCAGPRRRVLRLPRAFRRARCGKSATSIAAVMGAGLEFEQAAEPVKEELREAVGVLLRRAQAVGAVRADVTPTAVVSLVGATCHAAGHTIESPAMDLLNRLRRPAGTALDLEPVRVPSRRRPLRRCRPVSARAPTAPSGSIGLRKARPPSHSTTCPVTQSMPWTARITWAMSSASPNAQRGALGYPGQPGEVSTRNDGTGPSIGVRVTPGATALTRKPWAPIRRPPAPASRAPPWTRIRPWSDRRAARRRWRRDERGGPPLGQQDPGPAAQTQQRATAFTAMMRSKSSGLTSTSIPPWPTPAVTVTRPESPSAAASRRRPGRPHRGRSRRNRRPVRPRCPTSRPGCAETGTPRPKAAPMPDRLRSPGPVPQRRGPCASLRQPTRFPVRPASGQTVTRQTVTNSGPRSPSPEASWRRCTTLRS